MKSASFDLDARPAAAATEAQTYRMLRTLLEDRFSLRLRWETEDVNGYSLVTARGGSKLTSNTQADCAPPACGTQSVLARGQVIARGRSTDSLAGALEAVLGRPVRDETHLPGNYAFNLEFAPTAGQFGGNGREVADDVRPSIFTALEEQLGLKLEPATVPVEILVIDSAELPSSN